MKINGVGVIILCIMMLPNVMYFRISKEEHRREGSRLMTSLEMISRVVSMFFLCIKFDSMVYNGFLISLNAILLLVYLMCWDLFYRGREYEMVLTLAFVPALIFFLNALILKNIYFMISSLVFGASHLYITINNRKKVSD